MNCHTFKNQINMRKSITLLLLFTVLSFAESFANPVETLNYVISYKWGLISKDSGDATITVTPKGEGYELKLIGKTRSWADKFFKIRDTLISNVRKDLYLPDHYTRIAHEGGKYGRDDIQFIRKGNKVEGISKKTRQAKDGTISQSEQNLEGEGAVYDMLSAFFFIRHLDYHNLKEGEEVKAMMFSGTMAEQLTVKCKGKEKIKLKDKTEQEAWHITFKFTSGGGKKSSDDIDCWISTDPQHIPLLVVGNLTIGQIRCAYVPQA